MIQEHREYAREEVPLWTETVTVEVVITSKQQMPEKGGSLSRLRYRFLSRMCFV
jgi:hypothetical protein